MLSAMEIHGGYIYFPHRCPRGNKYKSFANRRPEGCPRDFGGWGIFIQ